MSRGRTGPRGYVDDILDGRGPLPAKSCRCEPPTRDGDSCHTCGRLLPGEVGVLTDDVTQYRDRMLARLASEIPNHDARL